MDIYVKPFKKVSFAEEKNVYVKDICEIYAPKKLKNKGEYTKVLEITENEQKNYLISIIKVIL